LGEYRLFASNWYTLIIACLVASVTSMEVIWPRALATRPSGHLQIAIQFPGLMELAYALLANRTKPLIGLEMEERRKYPAPKSTKRRIFVVMHQALGAD
jgi:hypothetical protein